MSTLKVDSIQGYSGTDVDITGSIKQTYTAPATDSSTELVRMNGSTVQGRSYDQAVFQLSNFPSYGAQFEDYFGIEYYDSGFYNFGTEFNVNGQGARLFTQPSGSGFGTGATIKTIDNYNTTADAVISSTNGKVQIDTPSLQITGSTETSGSVKTNDYFVIEGGSENVRGFLSPFNALTAYDGIALYRNDSSDKQQLTLWGQDGSSEIFLNTYTAGYLIDEVLHFKTSTTGVEFRDYWGNWLTQNSFGGAVFTRKATFNDTLKITPSDPLPAGALGELAVSGSNLYFHNGTSWQLK